ncbi:MAG: hypothetical protein LUF92_13190 [Clostridiales bacterium]|nr:hypothetical protein [Clostridiales bacterium]
MLYPFMTLNDTTEIVHSEMQDDGQVKVCIEKPVYGGFHSAVCFLPNYRWENIKSFSKEEMNYYQELIESTANIILELAQEGGHIFM